jgi:integrase
VLAIIDELPVTSGDLIFATNRTSLFHAKTAIDAQMKPTAPWVMHDLRRTAASGMARLGIRLPVIEKCLNHASGSFRGIVGVYQRHDFAAEKREALQRWANHVDAVVRGEPTGKVVQIRTGGR